VSPFPVYRQWFAAYFHDYLEKQSISFLDDWIESINQQDLKSKIEEQKIVFQFLLGMPESAQITEQWTMPRISDEILIALRNFFQIIRAEDINIPTLCVVEDLQLSSERFNTHFIALMQSLFEQEILFITTSRPETTEEQFLTSAIKTGVDSKMMTLRPFTRSECEEFYPILLQKNVWIDKISSKVLAEKSEGNPLFLSEIVFSLEANGFIENFKDMLHFDPKLVGFHVPETIHGLLLQKIDQLHDDEKMMIQFASMVGYQFPRNILLEMYKRTHFMSDFETIIQQLFDMRLLSNIPQKSEIKFTHGSVKNATQSTVLLRNKRKLHTLAAEIGEVEFVNEPTRRVLFLAYHWFGSKNTDKAIPAVLKALRLMVKEYNFEIGHQIYENSLEILDIKDPLHWENLIEVYELGFQLFDLTDMQDEMKTIYKNILVIADQSKESHFKQKAVYVQFLYYYRTKQLDKCVKQIPIVEDNLSKMENIDMRIELGILSAIVFSMKSQYEKAISYFESAIKLAETHQNDKLKSKALGSLAEVFRLQEDFKNARERLLHSIQLAEKIGDKRILLNRYASLGSVYRLEKNTEEAENNYYKALEISEALGAIKATIGIKITLALLDKERGYYEQSKTKFSNALHITEKIRDNGLTGIIFSHLGDIAKIEGKLDFAVRQYQRAIEIAEQMKNLRAIASRQRELATIEIMLGDFVAAERLISNSIKLYKDLKIDYLHVAEITLAEILYSQRDFAKSICIVQENIYQLESNEHRQDAWVEALILLCENYNQLGRYEETISLLKKYQPKIEKIAPNITHNYYFLYLNLAEAQMALDHDNFSTTLRVILENDASENQPKAAEYYHRIGKIFHNQQELHKSEQYAVRSREILLHKAKQIEDDNVRKQFVNTSPNQEIMEIEG